jgi:GntR family transcriptional repressor for pyruvate dehydrogenase complex
MTPSNFDGSRIEPIARRPVLSETVADRLQEVVLSGHIAPGERLPTERELAERFGVSRTVIREALRRLAGKGLVEARSGAGVTVTQVGASAIQDSMNHFLRSSAFLHPDRFQEALGMIHEVRTMLEVQIAGVAARERRESDLARLEASAEAMAASDDPRARAEGDVEFHRMIAAATRNVLYVVLLDSIRDPLTDIRLATLQLPGRLPDAIAGHRRIAEAIRGRDEDGARAAMADHLADSKRVLSRLNPEHLAMYTRFAHDER